MRLPTPRQVTALLAALATLVVAGCTRSEQPRPDGPVLLSVFWWGDQDRAARTEQALALYSARHPDVRFTVTWQGEAGYYDRLSTQSVGGNAPDIFQIDDARLADYAERGLLLDLTGPVTRGTIDVSSFPPGLADYGKVGERTVGVAAGTHTAAMLYNKTIAAEVGLPEPTTGMSYAALVDWADQIVGWTGGGVDGSADPSADVDAFWLWLRGQGRELYRGRGLGFGSQDLATWWQFWQDARVRRAVPAGPAAEAGARGDLDALVEGEAATAFGWSTDLAAAQGLTDDELGLVAYPGDPRAQWSRATYYWAGYRGSRNPDRVAEIVNFLVNDPAAVAALGTDRGFGANLPVRRTAMAGVTDPATRAALAFEDEMTPRLGPAPPPPPADHTRIVALFTEAAEHVRAGRMTAPEAAAGFAEKATATLAT